MKIDKVLHLSAGIIVTLALLYLGKPVDYILWVLLAVAAMKEMIDALRGSKADIFDFIATVGGLPIVLAIIWTIQFITYQLWLLRAVAAPTVAL